MSVCLLIGSVFAVFSSAESYDDQLAVSATGVSQLGYFGFDEYATGSTRFDDKSSTVTSTHGRTWMNEPGRKDTAIVVKEHVVDGGINKYLDFRAVSGYTSSSEAAYTVTLGDKEYIINGTVNYDFLVIDLDIRATEYVYVDDETGAKTLTTTTEDLSETELATAKLSYPEGLLFYTPVYGFFADGTEKTITRYFSLVSKNNEWYLTTNNSSSTATAPSYTVTEQGKLSNDINVWNHLTFIYDFTGTPTGNADRIDLYAYLNGEYVAKASSTGWGSTVKSYLKESTRIHIPKTIVALDTPSYAFGVDNWTTNIYAPSYTPTVENSIKNLGFGVAGKNIYDCDDVVYNENYISPNGNSFNVNWLDAEGNMALNESIPVGSVPAYKGVALPGINGDYTNTAAWEWNVSADKTVFTPISELTLDMVRTIRKRGDSSITIRPVIADVETKDESGKLLTFEKYYAGSTVAPYSAPTNGWYSIEYPIKNNLTEGEAADSLVIVAGKVNSFVVNESAARPAASIEGIRYNMSLLTNYYMNIYVPAATFDNVSFVGFYADKELTSKCTEGVRLVSIGDEVYHELSFAVANSDIDVNVPKYAAIEVTVGGVTHTLAYEISVNVLSYCKAVSESFACGSEESKLVCNLLNYANEAYKLANGEDNASAVLALSSHSGCGCVYNVDVIGDYKGSIDTLNSYLYGAAYNVNSAQPAFMLYLLADKADEVGKIELSYEGYYGKITAEPTALGATTVKGTRVIPYKYSAISASDIKEMMNIVIYGNNGEKLASGSYSISNYALSNEIPVVNALYAFSLAAEGYKKSAIGDADTPVLLEGISVEKNISLRPSTTVSIGDKITYTIKVTNNSAAALNIPVTDTMPANTYFVSGEAQRSGYELSWNVSLAAGESKTLSYTVALDKDSRLLGRDITLTRTAVNAGGNKATVNTVNYIARTINAVDAFYMKAGIDAMSYSDKDVLIALNTTANQEKAIESPMGALRHAYIIGFSLSCGIAADETADGVISALFETTATEKGIKYRRMVAPTLFGGKSVSSTVSGIKGESSMLEETDLVAGDILFVKDASGTRMYIYDGEKLVSFTNGYEQAHTLNAIALANAASYYAVLRPSMTMNTLHVSDPDTQPDEDLTAQQQALVDTAYQYLLRGLRLQYDDDGIGNSTYRWQIGAYQLEDYTKQNWRYINCAGFTYDIYYTALGYNLGSRYTTKALMNNFNKGSSKADRYAAVNDVYPFYHEWDASINADEAQKAAIEKQFMDTLQVGDLVVVTRGSLNSYGHVMMYIGNGMLAHSSGSSRSSDTENYEATIRYMSVSYYLFNSASSNYLFREDLASGTVYQTCIVRPLEECGNLAIPTNTQNRQNNLMGIISEKLSTHPEGLTVNKNGEITYTFRLQNVDNYAKTVTITDIVPANSTLVVADGATIDGNNLSWNVTVGANETKEVYYTVKATGEIGSYIEGNDATIGGVRHTCPKTLIGNTLTAEQQQAILEAVEYYKANKPTDVDVIGSINAIYEYAGLEAPFVDGENGTPELLTVRDSLFIASTSNSSLFQLNEECAWYNMVVPTMYGGSKLYTKCSYSSNPKVQSDLCRLPREQSLVIGDVIFARFSDSSGKPSYGIYMYVGGEHCINISASTGVLSVDSRYTHNRLQRLLSAGTYYAILRPSMK